MKDKDAKLLEEAYIQIEDSDDRRDEPDESGEIWLQIADAGYGIGDIIHASVTWGHGSGEELNDYLIQNGVDYGLAQKIVYTFNKMPSPDSPAPSPKFSDGENVWYIDDDAVDHEAKIISFSPSSNKYTITVAGGIEVGEVSGEELQHARK